MKAGPLRLMLLGAVVLASLAAAASIRIGGSPTTPAIPRVALMHVGTDHVPPPLGTLAGVLAVLGWIDGSHDELVARLVKDGHVGGPRIELIWRNLEPDQVKDQAGVYVREQVDVIVAFEDKSIAAAQLATARTEPRIPVVFLHPSDPVRDGLVASLSHPGGNLTGVFGARDPVVRQLELYQQIMPRLHRLVTLRYPADEASPPLLGEGKDAGQRPGLSRGIVVPPDVITRADVVYP